VSITAGSFTRPESGACVDVRADLASCEGEAVVAHAVDEPDVEEGEGGPAEAAPGEEQGDGVAGPGGAGRGGGPARACRGSNYLQGPRLALLTRYQ
jgi:hypothetical protein